MADKSTPLILDALTKAMADPVGVPLHGNKKTVGLFAAGAGAKQAARRCLEEGYLRVLHRETRGKSVQDVCTISEKGLAYLLSQVSPKAVLEELVRTLGAHKTHVAELVAATRRWQAGLDTLRTAVSKVLEQITLTDKETRRQGDKETDEWKANGSVSLSPCLPASLSPEPCLLVSLSRELMACLTQWQVSGSPGDCPLPELYRRVRRTAPSLTIGRFHDALRQLHEEEKVYLHPWSGPLYEIPEPPYAVLIGHEVAYYVSIR